MAAATEPKIAEIGGEASPGADGPPGGFSPAEPDIVLGSGAEHRLHIDRQAPTNLPMTSPIVMQPVGETIPEASA
jgi:hypothetical protein